MAQSNSVRISVEGNRGQTVCVPGPYIVSIVTRYVFGPRNTALAAEIRRAHYDFFIDF